MEYNDVFQEGGAEEDEDEEEVEDEQEGEEGGAPPPLRHSMSKLLKHAGELSSEVRYTEPYIVILQ